ncbi:MAG: sel1 repeat family protein [Spiribacter salinus]|uniref:Sel1 repeat family protein n=1 Tax=Spiribacter salinus TaxID=1335746 RepID=A0A540V888_9GAMM|nr:MAG: sel1 repeat family protein [Spiribacter salinus]
MEMPPLLVAFVLAGLTLGAHADDGDASEAPLSGFDSADEQLEEAMRVFFESDMANMTPQGPVEDTPLAEAVRLFQPLAEAGCAQAQYMLGSIQWGTQTQQAVEWGRRAAEQGHACGQDMIGYAYSTGNRSIDYPANAHEEGIRWYRRAAEQGHTDAMRELGYKHWHGLASSGIWLRTTSGRL